jgi:glutamate 5-kinase
VRIVVKVGSSTVLSPGGAPDSRALAELAGQWRRLVARGHELLVVSSGAVGCGRAIQGAGLSRPASAAVGQARLTALYQTLLAPVPVAQLLLLASDLVGTSGTHLAETLHSLLAEGILPILNENDATGHGSRRVGENDTLAARTARMVGADLLVLLSDVDGVYERAPSAPCATVIPHMTRETALSLCRSSAGIQESGPWGSGGMATKLRAAAMAAGSGIPAVIAAGRRPGVLVDIVGGRRIGTWVCTDPAPVREAVAYGS